MASDSSQLFASLKLLAPPPIWAAPIHYSLVNKANSLADCASRRPAPEPCGYCGPGAPLAHAQSRTNRMVASGRQHATAPSHVA